jgi:hypothetical protein
MPAGVGVAVTVADKPEQIDGLFTVTIGKELTVTDIDAVLAHVPDAGVKVYVVVEVVLILGLHVPEIEGVLVEAVGKVNVPPEQIAETWVNVGVTLGLTVTVIVAELAHDPDAGVKV